MNDKVGLPYNLAQYAVLHRLIAHVTGKQIGDMEFQLGDVHLYDRHFEQAQEFIEADELDAPEFWIAPDVECFLDFEYGQNFGFTNYNLNEGWAKKIVTKELTVNKDELNAKNLK